MKNNSIVNRIDIMIKLLFVCDKLSIYNYDSKIMWDWTSKQNFDIKGELNE